MKNLVTVSNLRKRFGDIQAVRDISFQVAEGEVLGFLGPNGAGKSTTMKMITGFLEPDAGEVEVGGTRLSEKPVRVKSAIGYLPEGAPLYADMTTLAFLRFAASMRGLSGKRLDERVEEVIGMVNLEDVRHQNLETLSKGFKRRVGIAQSILHDPPVLILDEPTDGLDPNQKHEVRELISRMAPRKAIILSTHILEEVEAVCSRAMIIAAGAIVADGTPSELASRAADDGTWIVEPMNPADLDSLGDALTAIEGIQGVRKITGAQGAPGLSVRTADPAVAERFRAFIGSQSTPISQFYRKRGRLDDVFREITGGASVRT